MIESTFELTEKSNEKLNKIQAGINSLVKTNLKSAVPKINFKKVKLNNFLMALKLNPNVLSDLNEPVIDLFLSFSYRKSSNNVDCINSNPLRKKISDDGTPLLKDLVSEDEDSSKSITAAEQNLTVDNRELAEVESEKQKSEDSIFDTNRVFLLDEGLLQESDQVSPLMPAYSASVNESALIWPPRKQKKSHKNKRAKSDKKKSAIFSKKVPEIKKRKKSYYISITKKPVVPNSEFEHNKMLEDEKISETLESQLLEFPSSVDLESVKQVDSVEVPFFYKTEVQSPLPSEKPFTNPLTYKAFMPSFTTDTVPEIKLNKKDSKK